MPISDYEGDVFWWGSAKPFKKGQRVSHKDKFNWCDVKTDGQGNVLEMPPLRGKPCFGRIEYLLRHGALKGKPQFVRGRIIEPLTRCGACPIRDACKWLCDERIKSDQNIQAKVQAWRLECKTHNGGKAAYTGPIGRYWTEVKRAIADHGPFNNVNDERLREEEIHARDVQVQKWRKDKKRQRERERIERAARHQPPSPQFMANAEAERDHRRETLWASAGDPSLPPEVAKIRPEQANRTAEVTANAWLIATIERAMGHDVKPGTVARKMVQKGLSAGLAYGSLKARMKKDLARVEILEAIGVWSRFDPDQDLQAIEFDDLENAEESAAEIPL